jgi:hypothetical protein
MTAASAAIATLLATVFLGALAGFHFFTRTRKRGVVWAHLLAALGATAVVAQLYITAPERGWWPLALLGFAVVAGWSASRIARAGSRGLANVVLPLHVAAGLAGSLVFLSWARGL